MLNYETLLSSYDDKLTLMQWLKKVEAALKDASAVSFNVNKRGDATLTFSVVFEDGSELETAPIILQQGESVQAATIRNGHLILTLTNGDELDAGDLGGVSGFSINASQHLIVTYQNGTTQDLGAIFTGDVTLAGNLTAVGVYATGTGVKTSVISQDVSSGIDVFASVVSLNNGLEAQGTIASDTSVKTPVLTSDEDEISAQKPVVEVMTGYSFEATAAGAGLTMDLNYVGVAKNGNKLTIVLALDLTRTGTIAASQRIGVLTIPASVANKLVPSSIGQGLYLDMKLAQAFYDESYAPASIVYFCNKATGSSITFNLKVQGLSALTQDVKYTIRLEQTFLLSENLAA